VANPELQSPRLAIIRQRDLLAHDTKTTAISGCRKPIARLRFLDRSSTRADCIPRACRGRGTATERCGTRADDLTHSGFFSGTTVAVGVG
jgi:hypothetical protein